MSKSSQIVALETGNDRPEAMQDDVAQSLDEVLAPDEAWEDAPENLDARPKARFGWVPPALALLTIAGWTGFFAYAQKDVLLAGGSLQQWTGWITSWAIPALLVVAIWLLAMRTSSREAARFGDAAKLLADEADRLETRLTTINRELSLARDFIAAQSRDLESLGRVAVERVSQSADRLAGLIVDNGKQIDSIASVSGTALENMDKLRGDLPVIANSARDVTSQIGNAGRTAHTQLEELVSGFHRLNTFGEASERQVQALRVKVDAALTAFEAQAARLGEMADSRFNALEETGETFRAELDSHEGEAFAALHRRVEKLAEEIAASREDFDALEASTLDNLGQRFTALREESTQLDATIVERQQAHLAHVEGLARRGDELAAHLAELGQRIEEISGQGIYANRNLVNAIEDLTARIAVNREQLAEADTAVSALTDSSVRLLELIQASSEHSRTQLPEALETAQQSLGEFEERTRAAARILEDAERRGKDMSTYLQSTREGGIAVLEEMDALHRKLAEHTETQGERIGALRAALTELSQESESLAGQARGGLTAGIENLQKALRGTIDQLDRESSDAIDRVAREIGAKSAEAVDQALRVRTAEAIGELETTAANAGSASREVARQLRDQLAKVDELAGNLEKRVQYARDRAEEQVDSDFARRVALITESLNSNAIDISKALSNEITDTAWAAYLRGDRGVFTRRAVRLLDKSQVREITTIYENDRDFREHVNRYIHDFETMLRNMLSTRDGNALGVTLLSSDMGKLYVVLAQAIERLRT